MLRGTILTSTTRCGVRSLYNASTTSKLAKPKRPRAAGLIIGDEILNGTVSDTNSKALATFLFKQGIELKRIETIGDDETAIVETVKRISPTVDYVITSGGIGPTHDDITYECLAKAFGRRLAFHQQTLERMDKSLRQKGQAVNEARRRMALFPWPAEVHFWSEDRWVPIVQVENVYILPGVPILFESMLEGTKHLNLFTGGLPPASAEILTHLFEGEFADALKSVQKSFSDLKIGSYPKMGDLVDYRARIRVEGFDGARVQECANLIQKRCEGFSIKLHNVNSSDWNEAS